MAESPPISLETLKSASIKAGKYALSEFGKAGYREKLEEHSGDSQYHREKSRLTKVDHACQHIILEEVGKASPGRFSVFAEEEDEVSSRLISEHFSACNVFSGWVLLIDPIDGTRNFASKSIGNAERGKDAFWGVSVCLLKERLPIMGAICYPALGMSVLETEASKGTFFNGKKVLLEKRSYLASDIVRVSGADRNLAPLRKILPDDINPPGSFVVTLLSLLGLRQSIPIVAEGNLPPNYSAYIGRNATLYDFGCASLAYSQAGGLVSDAFGKIFNPFESAEGTGNSLRITKLFSFSPSKEYFDGLSSQVSAEGHALSEI